MSVPDAPLSRLRERVGVKVTMKERRRRWPSSGRFAATFSREREKG